mgnify:FL=1
MAIASWLIPAAKSGTGNKTVGLTASKNTGASRTTIVTVSVSGITKTINCTQVEADKFTIKISALTTNSSGTTITNVGDCSIGSSATGGVKEGTYYRDTQVTLTAKAAPTGYDFVGWYEGSNLVSTSLSFAVTLTANRTLVAKYKIKSYTVNATSEDINKGTVSPAGQTVEHGANATVVATPKAAYNFAGWYNGTTKVSSNASYTFAVTANISLTAKFTIKTFTTTTANSTGGTASVNKSSVEYGGSAIWTATPSTGYNFSKWSNGSTANPLTVSNITANTHITPVFVLKSYTVTWNPNGGSVSPTSTTKTHGSTLGTLPTPTRAANAQYTYTFKGWFTAATGGTQVSASTTVTGNVTYYAQWTANIRSYTATFNGNGGGTPSPSTITKTYGSELGTLPTCSRTGYTFLGWYTASSGGTKISSATKITGTVTYYAQWSINSYTLTYNVNGGNAVSPASKSVQYGSAYGTLPTPTKNSNAEFTYAFAGWYTAASGGTQVTANTTMGASNTTIYAHWTATRRSYTIGYQTTYGSLNRTSQSVAYGSKGSCTLTMPSNDAQYTYTFQGWYTAANGGGTKVGSSLTLETPSVTGAATYYAYVTRAANRYTFTFNANGGSTPSSSSITKNYNEAIGTLPTCSRAADNTYTYAFAGWFDTSATSGGTQLTTTTKVTSNKTWYARWTANIRSYTATFNGNGGGTPSPSTITKTYGSELGTLPTCSRTGYTFLGWYTASSGGTKISSATKITGTVTYYAQWSINSYTLTYNVNGGNAVSPASKSVQYGSAYGTLPTPTKNSNAEFTYAFAGWYTAASGGTQVTANTTMGASNTTIYAHWTATRRSYTIGYQTTYGSLNRTSQSVAYGSKGSCTLTMPSNDAQYTYTFQGWYTAANGGGTKVGSSLTLETPSVTGAATYYAYVTRAANRYTFTFNANGGSTPSSSSITKNYNEAIGTLPTCSRAADNTYTYAFAGWFDTSATSGGTQLTTTTKVTSNKTWYARWTATYKNYTVTWNGNGGTPSKSSSSFHYNDALGTLPTATRTGYTFKGWSTSASGSVNVSTTTKVTGNVTYYAVWQINTYTLTVTAGTGGTVSGGGTYNYGATATLKATASSGYHFVKWSDGNTNASRTVTVTGNATYTATFERDPYLNLDKTSLTFEAAGGTQTIKVTSNVNWTVS